MKVDILPASLEDKPLLQRMMELYCYDFSTFDYGDLDEQGCFGYPYLDHYWVEEGRHPFLVRVDGKLEGFALVNRYTLLPNSECSMAEFFILRKYRRRGIGKQAACFIFDQFRGRWEVAQIAANPEARQFWKKAIGEYTGGKYEEVVLDDERWSGTVRSFENAVRTSSHPSNA